jgi:hypothetical protein
MEEGETAGSQEDAPVTAELVGKKRMAKKEEACKVKKKRK